MLAVIMNTTEPPAANIEPEPPDEAVNRRTTQWMVAVAEKRDRAAFERLYAHFAPRVRSYLLRQGADTTMADDVAQETLVQVWRKAGQFDASRAVPGAWIFRIARNLRIDRLRKKRFHEVDIDETWDLADDGADSSQRCCDRIDASRLPALVDELPAEQTEVVRLAYFEGLTHSEIGKRLELPLGTVKSRMRLAFGKLRAAMSDPIREQGIGEQT